MAHMLHGLPHKSPENVGFFFTIYKYRTSGWGYINVVESPETVVMFFNGYLMIFDIFPMG